MNTLFDLLENFKSEIAKLSLEELREHYKANKLLWLLAAIRGVKLEGIAGEALEKVKIKRARFYAGIGSRRTPEHVLEIMALIAEQLERKGFILRSGGAIGADKAFEKGAKRKQIFRPEHAKEWCFREINTVLPKGRPPLEKMRPYVRGLLGRNAMQILGPDGDSPVDFVVCWTPEGRDDGGTGYAIRLAWKYGIPVYNLRNPDQAREFSEKFGIDVGDLK